MASFITSSNNSIHSRVGQFNLKPHEISQCAENEVSAFMQPSNSDMVQHLNATLNSYRSHQLPVGRPTEANKGCVAAASTLDCCQKGLLKDYQKNLIRFKSLTVHLNIASIGRICPQQRQKRCDLLNHISSVNVQVQDNFKA